MERKGSKDAEKAGFPHFHSPYYYYYLINIFISYH